MLSVISDIFNTAYGTMISTTDKILLEYQGFHKIQQIEKSAYYFINMEKGISFLILNMQGEFNRNCKNCKSKRKCDVRISRDKTMRFY